MARSGGGAVDGVVRRLRQSGRGRAIAAALASAYIALVDRTTRWEVRGREEFDRLVDEEPGLIAVMWHGRLFMSPTYAPVPRRRTVAMISSNRDGDLITAIVRRWGVETVRGSTYDRGKGRDKGGAEAFAGAERALRDGALIAITPDGPRGPRMRAQSGTGQLAARTGRPVVPIAFSVARGRVLGSWDRFLLPLPFGRGVALFGPTIRPPDAPEPEAARAVTAAVERALTDLTAEADRLCGRAPVDPDPPIPGGPR
jgi:lysophospholipid acyltransferase (LPLAT)-like uncharacterized protein